MNNLIDFAQVIGSGLSNKHCYLSLQRVNQQEGTFWSYRSVEQTIPVVYGAVNTNGQQALK